MTYTDQNWKIPNIQIIKADRIRQARIPPIPGEPVSIYSQGEMAMTCGENSSSGK